jgi:hypothetical protein
VWQQSFGFDNVNMSKSILSWIHYRVLFKIEDETAKIISEKLHEWQEAISLMFGLVKSP